jgi:hypothetical protein
MRQDSTPGEGRLIASGARAQPVDKEKPFARAPLARLPRALVNNVRGKAEAQPGNNALRTGSGHSRPSFTTPGGRHGQDGANDVLCGVRTTCTGKQASNKAMILSQRDNGWLDCAQSRVAVNRCCREAIADAYPSLCAVRSPTFFHVRLDRFRGTPKPYPAARRLVNLNEISQAAVSFARAVDYRVGQ